MPIFDDLLNQLNDSGWTDVFHTNIDRAFAIARAVPLLHVTGRFIPLSNLLQQQHLPTSSGASVSSRTLALEGQFGITPAVYFYPGRAFPCHGPVVLAFAASNVESYAGSVTYVGVYGSLDNLIPNVVNYFCGSTHDFGPDPNLHEWRNSLGTMIAAYYRTPDDWWDSPPGRPDPERVYTTFERNPRAWAFEVRLHAPVSLRAVSKWCGRQGVAKDLHQAFLALPLGDPTRDFILWFLSQEVCLAPEGDFDYCRRMETWARREVP